MKSDNIAVENHGTFTMQGGSVEASVTGGSGVCNYNGGVFTMYGGSVEADNIAVDNNGTFTMHGGSVQSPNSAVYNKGTFTQENGILSGSVINRSEYNLHGGSVTVGMTDGIGVNNYDGGVFTMDGGSVTATGSEGIGVNNRDGGQFTMDGGSVTATGSEGIGIGNKGSFRIRAGRIEGGKAPHGCAVRCWKKAPNSFGEITVYYPLTPAEAEAACIHPDSAVLDGGFGKSFVVVGPASSGGLDEAGSLPETGSLPQTGDPSLLGAWVCLLGASGAMGMKLRRKK